MSEPNPTPIPEPANRAGITPADPPQDGLSQDLTVVVTGDVDQLPDQEA